MKLMKLLLVSLVLLFGVTGLQAADLTAHLGDSGQLLSAEADWMKACETKLAEYERITGIRILVQFHLKSPSEEEDRKPGAYMHGLAKKLGVDRRGVLVVYFHDDPDWRVWIGDELTNVFTGKSGTVQELTASDAIHEVKEAMLAAARVKADADIARAQKSTPGGTPLSVAQRLVCQVDALVEALQARLSPK